MHYTLIHSETVDGLDIRFYATPSDIDPRGQFDFDGADEVIQGIQDGRYEWFDAKIAAFKNGIELASDYLGGCCYETFATFVTDGGYYDEMRQTVINEARQAIVALAA